MIILISLTIVSIGTILLFQSHGVVGAVLFGIMAIAIDCSWQLLRFKLLPHTKTQDLVWLIYGGILIRIATIFLVMQLGRVWLEPKAFNLFVLSLLSIPVWSLIISRTASTGRAN